MYADIISMKWLYYTAVVLHNFEAWYNDVMDKKKQIKCLNCLLRL